MVLILEKVGLPEGYKREMVLVKNKLFKYHVQDLEYMGKMIEEKKLLPLEEKVPDGPYIAEGYIPRMLFSFNNIILTEFLVKMSEEEIAAEKERAERLFAHMEAARTQENPQ